MTVGILGLGLIGGSLARAYALAGHSVYAAEKNEAMLSFAILAGAVHGRLDESTIPNCDLILLAIYPDGSASWLEENAPLVSRDALVLDCCGIKKEICSRCFPLAEQYGFTFVGGHPMAGTQYSGIKYAKAGNHLHEISRAIGDYAESFGYGVVRDLCGHGIGSHLHEDPEIPNFKQFRRGIKLRPGMTLAIEPMINLGTPEVVWMDDDWTVIAEDMSLSAHYENTILITEDGDPEILTLTESEKS